MKVLFVCTGNTCRSPMAAALLCSRWKGKEPLEVASCGLATEDGFSASTYAVKAVAELGAELGDHSSRLLDERLVEDADLILTMTHGHKELLLAHFPQAQDRTYTLGEYVGVDLNVTDPFSGTLETYKKTAKQLEELIVKLIEKLELKEK